MMTKAVMDAMPNVLLAMKDDSKLQIIRDMLRRCSVEEVETHTSLKEAESVLRAHARKWDIFVIDDRLPEALAEIRAIREEMGPHVKILLLTTTPASTEEVLDAAMAGIDEFVGTPCSQIDLEDKIDKLMGKEIAPRKISRKSILYHMA